ncbi:hypothetical protein H8959_010479 [Pygathrix nigripes]
MAKRPCIVIPLFLRNSRTPGFVENEQSQPPQPLQIQIRCLRGLKDKAPPGSYVLKVSLLGRLGGCVLQWRQTEQLKTRTRSVRHNGNFYDVGLYFHENLYVVLPQKKNVSPGMAFLFELFLLRGTYACLDRAVGWAVFPLCDNNFNIVEGKFKCPLLRGHYDQKLSNFRKTEDLICLDLDHWLCNLYFQVIKLPLHLDGQKNHESHTRLSPEFPVCLMAEGEKAESRVHNTAGLSEKETEKNACASMDEEGAKSTVHSSQEGSKYFSSCYWGSPSPLEIMPSWTKYNSLPGSSISNPCFPKGRSTMRPELPYTHLTCFLGRARKPSQREFRLGEELKQMQLARDSVASCSGSHRGTDGSSRSPSILKLWNRKPWTNWTAELSWYAQTLVISSAGQPLTPLRDSDTQKGSVPTGVKEVENQSDAKKKGRRVC